MHHESISLLFEFFLTLLSFIFSYLIRTLFHHYSTFLIEDYSLYGRLFFSGISPFV